MAEKTDGSIRINSTDTMPALDNLKKFAEGIKGDYDTVSEYCDKIDEFKDGFKKMLELISSEPVEAAIKGIATLTVSIIRLNEEMERQRLVSQFGDIKISLEDVGRLVDPISEKIDNVAGAFAENEGKLSTAVTNFTDIAEAVRETADSFKEGGIEQNVEGFAAQLDKLLDSALEVNAATFDTNPLRKAFALDGVIDDEEQAVLDRIGEMGRGVADKIKGYGDDIHKITSAAIDENRELTEAELKNLEGVYQELNDMSTRHEKIKTAAAWEHLKDGAYSFESYMELAEKIKATQEQAEKSREAVEISAYESVMEQMEAAKEDGKSEAELEQLKQSALEYLKQDIAESRIEDKRYEREVILAWAQGYVQNAAKSYAYDPEAQENIPKIFDMYIKGFGNADAVPVDFAITDTFDRSQFDVIGTILKDMKENSGIDLFDELAQLNKEIGDSAYSLDDFYDAALKVADSFTPISVENILPTLEDLKEQPQKWSEMLSEWAKAANYNITMLGEFDEKGFNKEMDAYLARNKKLLEIGVKLTPAEPNSEFIGTQNTSYVSKNLPTPSSYTQPPFAAGMQYAQQTFEFPIYINGNYTETITASAPVALRPNWNDTTMNNGQGGIKMNDKKFVLLKIAPADGSGEPVPIGSGNVTRYGGTLADVDGDGGGTSENGYTIRDIRRRGKARLTVRFEGLTTPEFKALMKAISADEFSLTYFAGEYKTITAHAGDKDFELVRAKNETVGLWRLDVDFIEY